MAQRTTRTHTRTGRTRPGVRGTGNFYRIEVRPRKEFQTFRTQDVGRLGGLERLAGKRANGRWSTVSWLVAKDDAHREGDTLVIDDRQARTALARIGSRITHVRGDVFTAQPARTGKTKKASPSKRTSRMSTRGRKSTKRTRRAKTSSRAKKRSTARARTRRTKRS